MGCPQIDVVGFFLKNTHSAELALEGNFGLENGGFDVLCLLRPGRYFFYLDAVSERADGERRGTRVGPRSPKDASRPGTSADATPRSDVAPRRSPPSACSDERG